MLNGMKRLLNNVEEILASFMFIIMCIALFAQLFGRLVLNNPPFYTEEISRFAYVWLVYFGLAIGEKANAHYNVDLLPAFMKKAVAIVVDAVVIAMYGYLFYASLDFWQFSKVIITPALEWPMTVVSTCLCVGFALAAIRRLEKLAAKFKKGGATA